MTLSNVGGMVADPDEMQPWPTEAEVDAGFAAWEERRITRTRRRCADCGYIHRIGGNCPDC